ncbi:MAG TPA: hypothetical protein DDW36_03730 [Candidatus Magasanikbacteria bacterium]|nr:hypothetical protein [Candidatus Magasanikbacteria bacterium]
MKHYLLRNTKKQGEFTIFTYKEGVFFVSVCLELDIVKEGRNREKLAGQIMEAAVGHIKTVCSEKLDDSLLNRPAPKKYWNKYEQFLETLTKKQKAIGSLDRFDMKEACLS